MFEKYIRDIDDSTREQILSILSITDQINMANGLVAKDQDKLNAVADILVRGHWMKEQVNACETEEQVKNLFSTVF
jgi:hypothetical protein